MFRTRAVLGDKIGSKVFQIQSPKGQRPSALAAPSSQFVQFSLGNGLVLGGAGVSLPLTGCHPVTFVLLPFLSKV